MVIDIDSFLDKFDTDTKEEENKTLSLDFQKDVEDKLLDIRKDIDDEDLSVIKGIYDEVRSFNIDLPNKFLGLENKGAHALKELGQKYSDDFYNANIKNAKIISKSINDKLSQLDDVLEGANFSQILKIYKEIVKEYSFFPNYLLNEKIPLGSKIRDKEIDIFNILEKYKEDKVSEFKISFNQIFHDLKKAIISKSIKKTESSIIILQETVEKIPKILLSNLISERINASKFLRKAEEFLLSAYRIEFKLKREILNNLFERFHSNYLNKNLNEVLIIYNEIIFEFKSLPDTLFEEKISVYKEINGLYEKLNKLMINRNIFMLMESYEYGKRIESIREYLKHVELTQTYNIDNLTELKSKLDNLPNKFVYEKEDILRTLNPLLEKAKLNTNKKIIKKDDSNNNYFDLNTKIEDEEILNNKEEIIIKDSNNKYLKEIDKLYHQFKLTSTPEDTKLIYKKLMFAINVSPFDNNLKSDVIKKLNKALYEKKLI